MGAPPLPAPTETDTTVPTEVDVESQVSKPGDEKSAYSLPDDGTPVTIRTRGHRADKSQTSLLIEYFEGGKSGEGGSRRRPSVRVRLTPSKKSKGDHVQLTDYKGSHKASLTRRIPLDEVAAARNLDPGDGDESMTSYASATEESNVSRNPIDVEIDDGRRRRRPASPLIPSVESYAPGNQSEISAIPTDSFLDGPGGSREFNRYASPSAGDALAAAGTGAAAGQLHSRKTRGKEREKERAKGAEKSREPKDRAERERERKHRSKSRKSSASEVPPEEMRSPRRRSSRSRQDSVVSGPDSSAVSSTFTHSTRSGGPKSSINNPKLLETVEDAIRRLILPELSALKREQSKRETRRGSLTSTGTYDSREDVHSDRRRSSGRASSATAPKRRNREARHDYGGEASPMSISRDSLAEDYSDRDGAATPSRKGDMLKDALTGAAVAKGLSSMGDDSSHAERRERRRRRPESARSRSLGRDRYAEEYEDDQPAPPPPMPLMSDINPSELTRTSILSAESDRHSASEEKIHNVRRGTAGIPARELEEDPRTPTDLQYSLGLNHANVSQGDLKALPRGQSAPRSPGYDGAEYDCGTSGEDREERRLSDEGDYAEPTYEEQYFTQQDVPPPLKYVPYQAGARGLSPIPSVTEASEVHHPRLSVVSGDIPSPQRSPDRQDRMSRSIHSMSSIPSNTRSHDFEHMAGGAPRSPGAETYGEDSEINAGQAVRGVAANPNIIHPPVGIESAVASLIDGSQIDQSLMSYGGHRDSTLSYDDRSMTRSSRDVSPDKRYVDDRHDSPSARSQEHSEEFSEYEIDEHGRKVPRQRYHHGPTASEAVITAGAAAAAAAALKKAQGQKQASIEDESEFQGAGVARNKSFKERTMDGWEPRNTPAHSVDRFDEDEPPRMSARGGPDGNMPEAAYVDDDMLTNPSVVEERLDGQQLHDEPWSRGATPTPQDPQAEQGTQTPTNDHGLGITEAAGVAALGAAAGMAAAQSHQNSQDEEWHRTSDERKRDTLVTNPYEDASPVINPALQQNLRGLDPTYGQNYNSGSPYGAKFDEGYMSNGPNQTPDGKGRGVFLEDAHGEDPFYVSSKEGPGRQLSGMSQGMASPFYDAAMGGDIDRIENKDIVALMQHLMVRDAQRSARDTEIVALLMNAAVEMRNSFNEMKELIQETGDDVIFSNVENTEKLQKAINGPRPYPATAKSVQSSSFRAGTTLDEANGKSKGLWKRALAGLSNKGTNDLSRIEEMLMHLLGEVDVLKTQTAQPGQTVSPQTTGRDGSLEPELHEDEDKGYEPEGASTATQGSRSAHQISQNTQTTPKYERRDSNRISTVLENDEEYQYDHSSPVAERAGLTYLAPNAPRATQRGMSVPLDTPPRASGELGAFSAENTPNDKSKKHKSSGSSSWLPKISRWSETTASSVGRAFRGGKKNAKYDDHQPPSRSGSSLASYEDYGQDEPSDKLHSGFSDPNIGQQGTVSSFKGPQDRASPSFKGPAEASGFRGPTQLQSMFPEDPKYKAHRNSLNLQHPQPRPGQTERFRNALEHSAQEYDDPMTPRSADWAGSSTSLHRLPPQNTNRYSTTSSQAARDREAEYQNWAPATPGQQNAPPRPPKEPVEGEQAETSTPPRSNQRLGVPNRRPTGPRAMTPKSPEDEAREERRRKRDTFGTVGSNDTDTF